VYVMPNVLSPTLAAKYLEELKRDEAEMAEVAETYETAKARLDLGIRRYAALRDFVTEQLGRSPYYRAKNEALEPGQGRFRYAGMTIADAILELLREEAQNWPENPWLGLDEIVERLSSGGLGFPEGVPTRAINAALIRTSGIARNRTDGGSRIYSIEPTPPDEDEDESGKDE